VELDSANEKAYPLLFDHLRVSIENCEGGVKWTQKLLERDRPTAMLFRAWVPLFRRHLSNDYLKAIGYFTAALECGRKKGTGDCTNANLMLYIAQSNHFHAVA